MVRDSRKEADLFRRHWFGNDLSSGAMIEPDVTGSTLANQPDESGTPEAQRKSGLHP